MVDDHELAEVFLKIVSLWIDSVPSLSRREGEFKSDRIARKQRYNFTVRSIDKSGDGHDTTLPGQLPLRRCPFFL